MVRLSKWSRWSLGVVFPAALLVAQSVPHGPEYTADGRMLPPSGYREWVYLTSGLDMSYTPRGRSMGAAAGAGAMHMFDNVFATPEAYKAFLATGTWPDKTILALETRGAETNASINKGGHSQTQQLMGLEVHVKDESRGGWAFYSFDEPGPAKKIPLAADCYSCHRDHAAVDTTFVQFYPTLLPVATAKGTLSASYRKEAQAK